MDDATEIRVGIESLTDVAHTVHNVAEEVARPAVEQVGRAFGWGVHFGAGVSWASQEMADARARYRQCMQASVNATAGLARTVAAMAGAAELVAQAYGQVDALAAGRQSHIERAFGFVDAHLRQAEADAVAAATAAATQAREVERQFLAEHGPGSR